MLRQNNLLDLTKKKNEGEEYPMNRKAFIFISFFLVITFLVAAFYLPWNPHSQNTALYPQKEKPLDQPTAGPVKENKPKNVIFLIGDGMGIGQMEIARLFQYGKTGRLFMESLPNVALVHTYSANQPVTDSAAAGTALATGYKTNNEMLGITPSKKEVDSILDKFKKDGKKVGVITTSSITDATPAAFTASIANRWTDQRKIAEEQLNNKVDVLLGGGANKFKRTKPSEIDYIQRFKQNGYTIATNRSELAQAKGDKLLGLFNPNHMNFKIDRDERNSQEPTLTEMTKKGLEFLNRDQAGFFVMIEGARIDHASHSADFTSIWKEVMEFDHAVKYAVNWAKKNGDTLVLVTADHETMGVSETEPIDINNLKRLEVSPTFIAEKLKNGREIKINDIKKVKTIFKTYANISLSTEEVKDFMDRVNHPKGSVYKDSRLAWEIGSVIADHYHAGISRSENRSLSSTGGHTGNPVPLFTYGEGSEQFKGVLDNVDIPKIIAKIMDYQL